MSYWENSLHMMQVEVKGEESPSMICLCDSVLLHKYTEQIGIDMSIQICTAVDKEGSMQPFVELSCHGLAVEAKLA